MRFVVLQHSYQGVHYDFMLEAGAVLRTWKLQQPPAPGVTLAAVQSFDHRLQYLDFEGPISGDRGHVVRWDAGTYQGTLDDGPFLQVRLTGERLCGSVQLQRIQGEQWELRYDAE